MNKILLALLFFVLSPGVILTLPAGSKGVWMSRQTSVSAALVHALIFVIVLTVFKKCFYYVKREGFFAPPTTTTTTPPVITYTCSDSIPRGTCPTGRTCKKVKSGTTMKMACAV